MAQKKRVKEVENPNANALVLWFENLTISDVPLVGGKNASLGEMYQALTGRGVKVPNGFAVTAFAYRHFLDKAGLVEPIKSALTDLDTKNVHDLARKGEKVRNIILEAQFPEDLAGEITKNYDALCEKYNVENVDVAVRSSATAEDLPDASFAGQQESYLNIRGHEELLVACKKCFASLFTDRAISYRVDKGFDHFSIALSIGVQKMVRSDMACSGVMFSIDTESGFRDAVLVTGSYGLGENIVQGAVNPDEFYIHKPTLKTGFKPIVYRSLGEKDIKMIYSNNMHKPTKNVKVPDSDRKRYCLTDDEVLTLARWACIVEDHYSEEAKKFKPMDMEWAKDGESGDLFIVQARPETVQSQKDMTVLEEYVLQEKGNVLIEGNSVGSKIGAGKANVIMHVSGIDKFQKGDVLVTDMTDPDWEPIMKIASAIVTNRGGRTCHAAIISRELGIPCVVGTDDATGKIKSGKQITVDCSQGEKGLVYDGALKFEVMKHDLKKLPQLKTKIMMNVATPSQAFEQSFIPNEGVGLAREEFIINSVIKIHPNALINFNSIKDHKVREEIEDLTYGYEDKSQYFVDRLAEGIGMIAAAFYPKDVIVRTSDFKTNEYANLIGGQEYEPKEDNPMLGWRGASRYYKEGYKAGFVLECRAFKKVREEFGLKNVKIMIPFCRTIDEGKKVLKIMEDNGLKRGKDDLQVYVMCEIPSNVILADQFSEIFDGFSIGSNDLTQLVLGVDRDSEIVSDVYDERNDAVKNFISEVIKKAKKNHRKIGICGQAPSDFPDFAEFLVGEGIDSISLNPDTVLKTRLMIAKSRSKGKRSSSPKGKKKR